MTREQTPQRGAAEPSSAPSAGHPDAWTMASASRLKATAPRAQGYGPAFGNGAGAAFVIRDLASI